jgi:hypothetical protein
MFPELLVSNEKPGIATGILIFHGSGRIAGKPEVTRPGGGNVRIDDDTSTILPPTPQTQLSRRI